MFPKSTWVSLWHSFLSTLLLFLLLQLLLRSSLIPFTVKQSMFPKLTWVPLWHSFLSTLLLFLYMIEHSTGNWKVLGSIPSGVEAFLFSQKFSSNIYWKFHLVLNNVNSKSQLDKVNMVEFRYHGEWYTILIIDIIDWNDLGKFVNRRGNKKLLYLWVKKAPIIIASRKRFHIFL